MRKLIFTLFLALTYITGLSDAHSQDNVVNDMLKLKALAEKGHADSAIAYGNNCLNIYWKVRTDFKYKCSPREGHLLIKKFADKGNAEAQKIVGVNLYQGDGVAKNYVDSFNYLFKYI